MNHETIKLITMNHMYIIITSYKICLKCPSVLTQALTLTLKPQG